MIFIKKLRLENFGRHKALSASIEGFVPGLTGSNGLGKSTVLQGLQFALTGEIDHPDPAREFIRQSNEDKPPKAAEVEVEFEADGRTGRLVRRITQTSITHKMWWAGFEDPEKPVTKSREIDVLMKKILGVDKRAINSTVFIRQGETASMFGDKTDRRDFYTRLLMLEPMKKISERVDVFRQSQQDTIQDLTGVLDAADKESEEADQYFLRIDRELRSKPDPTADCAFAGDLLTRWDRKLEALQSLQSSQAAVEVFSPNNSEKAVQLCQSWGQRVEELSTVEANMRERKDTYASLRNKMLESEKIYENLVREIQLREDLNKAKEDLRMLDSNPVKDPSPEIESISETLRIVGELQSAEEKAAIALAAEKNAQDNLRNFKSGEAGWSGADEELLNQMRERGARIRSQRDLTQSLIDSVSGHSCFESCPLCHATSPPDVESLRGDIRKYDQELADARKCYADKEQAKKDYAAKESELDRLATSTSLAKEEANRNLSELKKRLADRGTVDTTEATRRLTHLQSSVRPGYHAQSYARNGHKKAIAAAEAALTRAPYQLERSEEDIARIKTTKVSDKFLFDRADVWGDEQENELKRVAAEREETQRKYHAAQTALTRMKDAADELEKREAALQEAVQKIPEGFFDGIQEDPETVLTRDEVVAKQTNLLDRQQERQQLKGSLESARAAQRRARDKSVELHNRIAEQKSRMELIKDLEAVRDAFKPNGVSLQYLDYKFGQIAEVASDYLAESGADFMVTASEDTPLAYDFLRTDREGEVWLSQSRMSGGQKVRLAVATLRAIHSIIMPDVGLLVLDEPTTHLDPDVQNDMAEMLKNIGNEETLQIVVCDHSLALVDAFSDHIKIQK